MPGSPSLQDRVEQLEAKVTNFAEWFRPFSKKWIQRWGLECFLPLILLPIGIVYLSHSLDEEPNVDMRFQGKIDKLAAEKKLAKYSIRIANISSITAPGQNGILTVSFLDVIVNVTKSLHMPEGSYFTDENQDPIDTCENRTSCRLVWGEMVGEGYWLIEFTAKGEINEAPRASYGSKPITEWKCNTGNETLDKQCNRRVGRSRK